jgi:glutamate formiminotransferase/formiminotetrahydrofolate cyclodeaminase
VKGQALKDWFAAAVDRDTEAFNTVLAAGRIKTGTEEEAAAKAVAVRDANRGATLVPLEVLERTPELLELAHAAADDGNPNSASDAGVAGLTARSCAEGAWYNVLINLQGLGDDAAWAAEARTRGERALHRTRTAADKLATAMELRLAAQP